ncbi:MAG: hypothetical protein WAM70_18595 [Pyrinomonadaceae bacterium]
MATSSFASSVSVLLLLLFIVLAGSNVQTQDRRPISRVLSQPDTQATPQPKQQPQIRKFGKPSAMNLEKVLPRAMCDPQKQESIDFSGNFGGEVTSLDGRLIGVATLEIKDDKFTLTVGNQEIRGKISAIQTCDVTAVGLTFEAQFNDFKFGAPSTLGVSLRAKKCGKGFKLVTTPNQAMAFVFTESSAKGQQCGVYCPRPPCPTRPVDP